MVVELRSHKPRGVAKKKVSQNVWKKNRKVKNGLESFHQILTVNPIYFIPVSFFYTQGFFGYKNRVLNYKIIF